MISIVISSCNEQLFLELEKNIIESIGTAFEIIRINNPNLMGICEAYNKGASMAKYDYFLFIHEDIIFQTQNWGKLLMNHLKRENTGVIGLAGSNYVPRAPSSWSLSDSKYTFCNVNSKEMKAIKPIPYDKVFAIDGVFLAIKKSVYLQFIFDQNIKGFHGYDTDFSLRVASQYDNYVISDIFITHFSKGNPDKLWIESNIQIRKKIKIQYNKNFDENLETQMFQYFLNTYFLYYKLNIKNILATLHFFPNKVNLNNKLDIYRTYLNHFKSRIYFIIKDHCLK
jgi:hypothetical protein